VPDPNRPRGGAHRAGRRLPAPSGPLPPVAPDRRHWPDQPYPRPPWLSRALAGPLARSIAWSGLSVAIVAAVIAVVWAVGGRSPGNDADAHRPTGLRASGGPGSIGGLGPLSSSATTTRPSGSASPSAAATTTSPATQRSTARPRVVRLPLLVLNDSRIPGLAARAAADFHAAGWPIAGTGNYAGQLPRTTVFYPPGERAAARLLVSRFPAITRMLPRFRGLPGSGLTVVVTRYYRH
jgi:hypothetical protein